MWNTICSIFTVIFLTHSFKFNFLTELEYQIYFCKNYIISKDVLSTVNLAMYWLTCFQNTNNRAKTMGPLYCQDIQECCDIGQCPISVRCHPPRSHQLETYRPGSPYLTIPASSGPSYSFSLLNLCNSLIYTLIQIVRKK